MGMSKVQDEQDFWDRYDSPTRQLYIDMAKLRVNEELRIKSELDERDLEVECQHLAELKRSAEEHARINQQAKTTYNLHMAQLEARRLQEEADLKRRLEEQLRQNREQARAKERAEQEARDRERREQEEHERRLREQKERQEREAREAREARERENKEEQRKAKEAQEARNAQEAREAQQAAEAAQAKSKPPPPAGIPTQASSSASRPQHSAPKPPTSAASGPAASKVIEQLSDIHLRAKQAREEIHRRYLEAHRELKNMRRNVAAYGKQNPDFKKAVGEMRREITKVCGQISIETPGAQPTNSKQSNNKQRTLQIKNILEDASKSSLFPLDIRPYIVSRPIPPHLNNENAKAPVLLLYLLNILAKVLIKQIIEEVSQRDKVADPLAVMAVTIFSEPALCWNGISLIDILLAKYHLAAPALFGIYGKETTENGRARIGWARNGDGNGWIPEQTHAERMTGLGRGFAAMSLRKFPSKWVEQKNPLPPHNFYEAIAGIVNVPPGEVTQTHFYLLKALTEEKWAGKFVGVYGKAAIAVLRHALVEFPSRAPKSQGRDAVAAVPEVLKRDLKLTL
ncbi:GLE1-domain-containing protein [Aulographum hederae CBS 113979]|uniref:mRNA export factor GLE1 n=1 Tax=Aulographum hederae CBS 113979 TaxID=1176131 RepID=A0A6G1H820_9PEZI|nr:GLE1-domain-containing protein [Aulographum hederae CBS 113979]